MIAAGIALLSTFGLELGAASVLGPLIGWFTGPWVGLSKSIIKLALTIDERHPLLPEQQSYIREYNQLMRTAHTKADEIALYNKYRTSRYHN